MNSAHFIGTKDNFNKYFSGFCRNLIQRVTKKYKKEVGKCEHCGESNKQLDSAHVYGKERKIIIDSILKKFEKDDGLYVDLNEFEKMFVESHNPIDKTIKILCKKCHTIYDGGGRKTETKKTKTINIPTQRVNKKSIIDLIENSLECVIDVKNFNISTINKSGLFSVEPKKNCNETVWHLCLINNRDSLIHYFKVPKESNIYSNLYFRNDKKRYRLVFEISDETFNEKYSFIKFKKFLFKTIEYHL
jgi:hypothetical protein